MKKFNEYNLSEDIKQSLEVLHYTDPTEVQQKVIPLALKKIDLIVKSRTGSGKTASFGIPICELIDWEENKVQALILTPTRELAEQVKEELISIGRFKRLNVISIYGKQPFEKQKLALKQKTHVVVGTPGRVLDHIEKGTFPLDKIKYTVIDEADEMLNRGFIDQVESIIQTLPKDRVTSVYSATYTDEIENLCHTYLKNPKKVVIEAKEHQINLISHSFIHCNEKEKVLLLKDITIVENPDSCIVFCNTQDKVDDVYKELRKSNYSCNKIHGGLIQKDRLSIMEDYKRGSFRYLVATDLAARGIDVENINLIINYDFPFKEENYVHRTGRTGRAGKYGKAISLITPKEKQSISSFENYIGINITFEDPPSKETVAKAHTLFKEKMKEVSKRKVMKADLVNKDIMKLYFNGGKKKKLRAVDFVGTITSIDGVTGEDIGIISIQETTTYVDILNGKGNYVLKEMRNMTIKGKQLKVHKAKE
ncbi:DEAD/DEAH box helicase [Evansella sp. AB-rgal1]|uniref:DEAD/DEAH box helicase n=1 Tax=Evansella sp. AB-rgal1 TaxID=3242696 RepID=UPI00359D260E